ncbi:hypothetical protein EJ110_NYTH20793 [Nymphaea thermarum]|nr:hypothetical protein EJ110_NYTH20793 [Nymphaea thermarum]
MHACVISYGDNGWIEASALVLDEDQDWGLWVDDNQIGYWPKSNYRARSANTIEWGGEIVNKQTRGRHTSTQMGNGRFSSEPIGRVAYIRNMALYDLDLDRYHAPGDINGVVTKPNCYDLRYSHSDDEYGDHLHQYHTFNTSRIGGKLSSHELGIGGVYTTSFRTYDVGASVVGEVVHRERVMCTGMYHAQLSGASHVSSYAHVPHGVENRGGYRAAAPSGPSGRPARPRPGPIRLPGWAGPGTGPAHQNQARPVWRAPVVGRSGSGGPTVFDRSARVVFHRQAAGHPTSWVATGGCLPDGRPLPTKKQRGAELQYWRRETERRERDQRGRREGGDGEQRGMGAEKTEREKGRGSRGRGCETADGRGGDGKGKRVGPRREKEGVGPGPAREVITRPGPLRSRAGPGSLKSGPITKILGPGPARCPGLVEKTEQQKENVSRMLRDLAMSSKPLCMLLLLVILFNHGMLSEGGRHILESKYYPKEFPIKIIKTITMDDGDIYDCKKIHSQPSKRSISISKRKKQTSDKLRDSRIAESGTEGDRKFSSSQGHQGRASQFQCSSRFCKFTCQYAKGVVSGTYGGGEGTFSVWGPNIEDRSEMSLSQVWVVHASQHQIYMALEAGWMNDSYKTWLYNDNTKSPEDEGSNNLEFVRRDQGMPFGKRLRCQTINGNPSEIDITIIRNDEQDWEVLFDETLIGYWPKSNYEVNSANEVAWGGEIVNRRTRGRHTSTQMGSGHFSTDDLGTVAYIRKMALYDLDTDLYYPPEEDIGIIMNNGNCYDATYWDLRKADDDDDFGHYITVGGPAKSITPWK